MQRWCSFQRIGTAASLRAVSLCAVLALAAIGATRAEAGDTVTVKGMITTAPDLNPDYRGRPSPVKLMVYQLAAAEAFSNADFFSLQSANDTDPGILGGDLIKRSDRMLQPGIEGMEIEEEFDENARFIGIVAAFQDVQNAEWRGLIELPDQGFFKKLFSRKKMMIELEPLAVRATIE